MALMNKAKPVTSVKPETKNTEGNGSTESVPAASPFAPSKADVFKVERTRNADPIPQYVYDGVKQSLSEPLCVAVKDEKDFGRLRSQLNRVGAELGYQVQIRPTKWAEGTTQLHFRAASHRRQRKYTNADVKNWYKATYQKDLPEGRIPKEIRAEFRKANGYDKP